MSLLDRVRRFATRHSMWRPATRVVAAVSGGSDSVGMLVLLHDLHARGELVLDAVAHLNHRIRPEAARDEAFCRELAGRLDVPFVSASADVPSLARDRRQSLELAGRIARRAFLDDVRQSRGADCIATAHTEDDQAETVMLRLMRGTGGRGLSGIAPRRDRRIRPMLCATRADLRRELQTRQMLWCEDSTNADLAPPRNRIRHQLMPYLESHFNPSIRRALARTADVAWHEDALLAREAVAATVGILRHDDERVVIDGARLLMLPDALGRRVVIHALAMARTAAPSHDDVEAVLNVARGEVRAVTLSRVRAEHFGEKVVLVPSGGPQSGRRPAPFRYDLAVPGHVATGAGWVVEAETFPQPQRIATQPDVAQIDAGRVSGGLVVRNRRPGDRIRPVGLGGRKKLQDVLVDRKVARHDRDAVPIVTDTEGRIVWVAGHALSEEFRVTNLTKGVIILKLRRI